MTTDAGDWAALGAVFVLHVAALISPGPNMLIVTQAAAGQSRLAGLSAAAGVATGAGVWATLTALGLAVLLQRFAWAAVALKVLGGAYLVFVGLKLLSRAPRDLAVEAARGTRRSFYWRGLLANLSNAQAAIFFASIFAVLPETGLAGWFLLAAVTLVVANSLAFHAVLALALSTSRLRQAYHRQARWLDRGAGAVMILFGGRLLLLR